MGYIVEAKCDNCGDEKTFCLGNGMSDFRCDNVAKNFTDKDIIDIIYSNEGNWTFNWKLAQCRQCRKLFRVPTILSFDEEKGSKEFAEIKCECGCREASVIDVEVEKKLKCATCEGTYTLTGKGLWD
ncbi:MAG: hypothetical protein E7266_04580 [Lachnospiraceae bacterium]|nr:hypothetical protein [Lachnospiraceae bacterium]